MKKLNVTQLLWILALFFISASCKKEHQFTIKGILNGGEGKTLYFENVGVSKIILLDSVQLKKGGSFQFKHARPEAPDFYRLRLGQQWINLVIDSTETLTVNADTLRFAQAYQVENSNTNEKIKALTLLQLQTNENYTDLQNSFNNKTITADIYTLRLDSLLNLYKDFARKIIYENPKSPVAYFALFQQINNLLIFNPYEKNDYKAFGAVATSWNQYYPNALRSKHLYGLAMQALKVIRGERPIEYKTEDGSQHFKVELPNIYGQVINMKDTCHNKAVLLDFTAYELDDSPAHNMQLASIYKKYKSQGFEIFQVSLDADEHLWKNAANNLPWLCVRDPQSIYSKVAANYNVQNLPTSYLINKAGEIVKRVDSYDNLEKELAPLLK